MNIIKIGEPLVTKAGTVITKYVEDGRLYKSIDFQHSTNRCAQQKGLVKTVVRYGKRNQPESIFDTFERKVVRAEAKPVETPLKPQAEPKKVETKPITESEVKPVEKTETVGKNSAGTERVIPISTDNFNGETAKKLYQKIHKYVKLAGENGSVKDAKIMSEEGYDLGRKTKFSQLKKSADVVLSVNRVDGDLHIALGRNNKDKSREFMLFDAIFDKNGQMKEGMFPLEKMTFNRYGNNTRRLKKQETCFLPVAENDREWLSTSGLRISPSSSENLWYVNEDNAVGGAFEVFLELARLHTSILK